MYLIKYLLIIIGLAILSRSNTDEKDFYKLLDVPRDADNRVIRKAFKQLAVKLHPDKNPDDEDAQAKFILLTRAYDTLKDPDARKHYDLYGDVKENEFSRQNTYRSYSYYQDDFGIYDDDPNIITLGVHDFDSNINDPNVAWFINFYSPQCWHCHELAPTWRKLAAQLEGVIRIGAVNCEEDWQLCTQLQIRGYPTLLIFSNDAHMFEGEPYEGERTVDDMQNFVIEYLDLDIDLLSANDWHNEGLDRQESLLFLCGSEGICPEDHTMFKLTAMLDGLVAVAKVEDPNLCSEIYADYLKSPVIFWKAVQQDDKDFSEEVKDDAGLKEKSRVHTLTGSDSHELAKQVLDLLPEPTELDQETFSDERTRLRLGKSQAWLICFSLGDSTELKVQLKKLPAFLTHMNIGIVYCARSADLCASLHVSHYPAWAVLKEGGAFEMHHGRDTLHDITSFARDSSLATNFHALSPADFRNIMKDGNAWFVDWYAPWCPPCQRVMPELRRASQHFKPETISFGTVDCTLHSSLCSQQNIRSYPTIILYNASKINYFHGRMYEQNIVNYLNDMLNPVVITLNAETFKKLLVRKPETEIWLVDYSASWCGPCQKLTYQWRQLAKEVSHIPEVRVAQVDCVEEADLCSDQNIRTYPTIRLYPLGSRGLNTVAIYNGHLDVPSLKPWLFGFLPSPILELNPTEFYDQVIKTVKSPWLVDFYAPWCGHCHHFEPDYITVAQRLEDSVQSGKINCDEHSKVCQEQGVHGYPTLMLYITPTKRYEITMRIAQNIIDQVKRLLAKHQKDQSHHDEL